MSNNQLAQYRPDIDGLRAIAVLSVVFYHFGFGSLQGGFVGVDIFFVISGYLITGIIKREIESGSFSILRFYERRIRRIFPALFFMMALVSVGVWFFLLPTDTVVFGKSLISTVLFGSNIFYWRTTDYFKTDAELNPLLHTWSLSVEEQFYLFFPMFLILLNAYCKRHTRALLWLSVLASLVLCVFLQNYKPTAVFYVTVFRAWELGLGSLLAFRAIPELKSNSVAKFASALGLALLIASILFIPAGRTFPGWLALFPVVGTGLLIHSAGQGGLVERTLSSRPLVWVGLVSYSLYLWHWPVLVLSKFALGVEKAADLKWIFLLISFGMAYLSYRFIEKPFRDKGGWLYFSRKNLFIIAAFSTLALAVVGIFMTADSGHKGRYSEAVLKIDNVRTDPRVFIACADNPLKAVKDSRCLIGSKNISPSVVLWGDSMVLDSSPAFDVALGRLNVSGITIPNSSCPGIYGVQLSRDLNCFSDNEKFRDWVSGRKDIEVVIMFSSWNYYASIDYQAKISIDLKQSSLVNRQALQRSFDVTINELLALGKRVVVIAPLPPSAIHPYESAIEVKNNKKMPVNSDLPMAEYYASRAIYDQWTRSLKNRKNVYLIDPLPWFCRESKCMGMNDGQPLYRDHGINAHLSLPGNRFITPSLSKALEPVFLDVDND